MCRGRLGHGSAAMKGRGALKNVTISNIATAEMHRTGVADNLALNIPADAASKRTAPRLLCHGQLLISCCGVDMVLRG